MTPDIFPSDASFVKTGDEVLDRLVDGKGPEGTVVVIWSDASWFRATVEERLVVLGIWDAASGIFDREFVLSWAAAGRCGRCRWGSGDRDGCHFGSRLLLREDKMIRWSEL